MQPAPLSASGSNPRARFWCSPRLGKCNASECDEGSTFDKNHRGTIRAARIRYKRISVNTITLLDCLRAQGNVVQQPAKLDLVHHCVVLPDVPRARTTSGVERAAPCVAIGRAPSPVYGKLLKNQYRGPARTSIHRKANYALGATIINCARPDRLAAFDAATGV